MKSYTSIEQAKKLIEFLPLKSADMYYSDWKRMTKDIRIAHVGSGEIGDLPCWSLSALLSVLPSASLDNSDDHHFRLHCMEKFTEWYDNPIDACVAMIEKLHEQKLL